MAGMDNWGEAIFAVSDPKDKQTILKVNSTSGKHRATDSRREDEVNDGMKSPNTPSVTEQNMTNLDDLIDRLYKDAEMLGIRLESVLTESSPEAASERRGYGGSSALSERLAVYCRRLEDLHDRLSYLTARIDL